MGCDIHLHSEVKINGKWEHYNHIRVPRNYLLFGLMAGVRDHSVTPIAPPRGLPGDMSLITAIDYAHWTPDAHTSSWLSSAELLALAEAGAKAGIQGKHLQEGSLYWESDYFGYLFGNTYAGFTKYPGERPKGVEDVRFVFWFDN